MGAKISRFTDSINKRRRRSSRSSDDVMPRNVQSNGSLETGHDPAVHGASLEDRNYNNESFKRRDVDPSNPQQNEAATRIQTQYRQHSAKEEVTELKEEMAATRIQAGFRGFLDREQVREMKTHPDDAEETPAATTTEGGEEEVDIDLEDPEVEKAAIKIQAGFKGFKARKEVQDKSDKPEGEEEEKKENNDNEEEIDIDLGDPEVQKAALKIQTGFRGHQARKDLNTIKQDPPMKNEKEIENREKKENEEKKKKEEEEEEVDIDLEDPEVGKAALKIQAGFKGLKARKQMATKKKEEVPGPPATKTASPIKGVTKTQTPPENVGDKHRNTDSGISDELADIDLKDPDLAKVTLKLQAGFRGFKSRKKTTTPIKPESASPSTTTSGTPQATDSYRSSNTTSASSGVSTSSSIKNTSNLTDDDVTPRKPNREEDNNTPSVGEVKSAELSDELKDIDLTDPDLGKAALKLQAGFRFLKKNKKKEPVTDCKALRTTNAAPPQERAAAETSEATKPEVSLSPQQEPPVTEEEVDIDLNDPEVEKAAVKIQAGFKGLKARKGVAAKQKEQTEAAAPAADEGEKKTEEEEVDIDLEDPATEKAALKIQAGFRGYQTRKDLNQNNDADGGGEGDKVEAAEETTVAADNEEEIDIDLNDPEVEKAATKIQAGFKGLKTRKEMKAMKNEKEADKEGEGEGEAKAETTSEDQVDAVPANGQQETTEGAAAVEENLAQESAPVEEEKKDEESAPAVTEETPVAPAEEGEKSEGVEVETNEEGVEEKKENVEEKKEEGVDEKKEEDVEKKEEESVEEKKEDEVVDIDLEDPNVEHAALKIQAGFKGMKTRKEVKAMKADGEKSEEGGEDQGEKEEVVAGDEDGEKKVEEEEEKAEVAGDESGEKKEKGDDVTKGEDGGEQVEEEKKVLEEEGEKTADEPEAVTEQEKEEVEKQEEKEVEKAVEEQSAKEEEKEEGQVAAE